MLPVLLVALAVDVLAAGDGAVGLLNAALGLGGLVGGAAALTIVSRYRLAGALAIALLLWGVGVAAAGSRPLLAVAVLGLIGAGAGRAILEVAAVTLLQRTIPVSRRASVFGTFEVIVSASVAAGAIFGAFLVAAVGPQLGLAVTGTISVVAALVSWPQVRHADDGAHLQEREIRLLRGVPMLRPLPLCTTEELAMDLRRQTVEAGTEIIHQGDPGDVFYILEAGHAEVEVDGSVVRTLGAGEGFGEIALLNDSPRTATVRAVEPSTLVAMRRELFLSAVMARPEASLAAQEVIRGYLG